MFNEVTILGGRGMLGCDLAVQAKACGFSVRVFDLPEFDISDKKQLDGIISESEVVVNCAAYTNVEKAEADVEQANLINGYAVGFLGETAKKYDVPVIHISTDFVFGGEKETAYVESDETNPLSVYGSSKLLGEKLLEESGCRSCILRVEWTYGKNGVNFISKILAAAEKLDKLRVVDDQIGCPSHTVEVAKVICDLLNGERFAVGLYHVAAGGCVSRYEMTRFIFDKLGITTELEACKSDEFKTAAQRPLNSSFNCEKIEKVINRKLPGWQEMLEKYLELL